MNDQTRTPVVVKYFSILMGWSICHRESHQSAFRSKVNIFDTYAAAVTFAENNGCEVFDV